MIILMKESLVIPKDLIVEDSFPGDWFLEMGKPEQRFATVLYEEELHKPGESARSIKGGVFDLAQSGILKELEQLRQLGVQGQVHFADSCGPYYIRIMLTADRLLRDYGEVEWPLKWQEIDIEGDVV